MQQQPLSDDCAKHETQCWRFFILFQLYVIHLLKKIKFNYLPNPIIYHLFEGEVKLNYYIVPDCSNFKIKIVGENENGVAICYFFY